MLLTLRNLILVLAVYAVCAGPLSALAASPRYQELSAQLLARAQADIGQNKALSAAIENGTVAENLAPEALSEIREVLTQALAANPKNTHAYLLLGALALAEKDNDAASRHAGTAVQIDPTMRDAYVLKVRADLGRGEIEPAHETQNQLLSLCGTCPQTVTVANLIAAYEVEQKSKTGKQGGSKSVGEKPVGKKNDDAVAPSESDQ